FTFPENDLEIEVSPRARSIGIPALSEAECTPQLVTALDEFTRDFRTVVVGRYSDALVPRVARTLLPPPRYPIDAVTGNGEAVGDEEEVPEGTDSDTPEVRLLQQYCPTYSGTPSTYRKLPPHDLRALLGDRPSHFTWLKVDCNKLVFGVGEPEPLFCSLTMYRIEGKPTKKGFELDRRNSGRVSETF
ncbi:hypothetical protein JKP88DRAFT_149284, partial [Tribonema minus]